MKKFISAVFKGLLLVFCLALSAAFLLNFVLDSGEARKSDVGAAVSYEIMDRYDTYVTNTRSDALEGVLSIKKVYWLSDDDLIAPEPDQDKFGETDDPSTLQWLLDDAAELLDGQETLFNTDVRLFRDSKVTYYLDETIFAVTWKEAINNTVYTISEVKIADPSQFRRFLADGVFASGSKYAGREMAESVNAVVASSGDYYSFRNMGIIVYDSQLMRMEGFWMDTCFIDANGDLQFVHKGEIMDEAVAEQYVKDHGVRFSLAFGPILIEDGVVQKIPATYPVGEGDVCNPRMAIGQLGELHYLLVAVSAEPPYEYGHTLKQLAAKMADFGCIQAYNLDGGGTATLVMNDKLMNYVFERMIGDIIYFATAVPDGE